MLTNERVMICSSGNRFTKWWGKHRANLAICVMLAVTALVIFAVPFGNGDEMWNYQFAKNVAEGKLPYRDFNIVQTPLSAYIGAPFLLLFGGGLFAYRVAGYVATALLAIELYRVCVKASGCKSISFAATAVLTLLNSTYIIFNYNTLGALLLLIVLDLEFSENDAGWKQLVIGFLVGFAPLLKQTIGAFAMAANFAVVLVNIFAYKKAKKAQILRVLVSAVPLLGYAAFLLITGTFDDFWEYAIVGIGTFTHSFTFVQMLSMFPIYIMPTFIIVAEFGLAGWRIIKRTLSSKRVAAIAFSIAWFIVAYPLCDPSHFLLVFYLVLPAVFMLLPDINKFESCGKKAFVSVGVMFCIFTYLISIPIGKNVSFTKIKNCEGIPIEAGIETTVTKVVEYIECQESKGYEVKIAGPSAAAYHIPMDRYEKEWSMLLAGNIGLTTVEELISSECPRLYLVERENASLMDQSFQALSKYIQEHYTMVETYGAFDVYVTDATLF